MSLKKLITGALAVLCVFAFSGGAFADVTGKTYDEETIQKITLKIKKVGKTKTVETFPETVIFHEDGVFEMVTRGLFGTWEYVNKKKIVVTIAPEVYEAVGQFMLESEGYDVIVTYRSASLIYIEKKDGSVKSKAKGVADLVFPGLLDGDDATGTLTVKIKSVGVPVE